MGRILSPRQQLKLLAFSLGREDLDRWTDQEVQTLIQAFPLRYALSTSLLVVQGPQLAKTKPTT